MTMKSKKANAGGDDHPGAKVSFPYDRLTVERFRERFPRARWSDDLKAWFVPGKTAAKRFQRWLDRESSQSDIHADLKGRDAYAFEPVISNYLRLLENGLEVVTPYSRTVIREMREVPFAFWDAERRVWMVPYRSYENLRRRWTRIEEAARRNEPEERKKRQAENRGSQKELAARARVKERRRRRYPVDTENMPPFGRPVMTSEYGIVVFVGCDGEAVDPQIVQASYAKVPLGIDYIWGQWRPATLDELVKTWPARRGFQTSPVCWWQPTLDELRLARRTAARMERRKSKVGA
jgi:hypothetical protein